MYYLSTVFQSIRSGHFHPLFCQSLLSTECSVYFLFFFAFPPFFLDWWGGWDEFVFWLLHSASHSFIWQRFPSLYYTKRLLYTYLYTYTVLLQILFYFVCPCACVSSRFDHISCKQTCQIFASPRIDKCQYKDILGAKKGEELNK